MKGRRTAARRSEEQKWSIGIDNFKTIVLLCANISAHELAWQERPSRSAKRVSHLEEVVFNQTFAICLARAWTKCREKVGFLNAIVDPAADHRSIIFQNALSPYQRVWPNSLTWQLVCSVFYMFYVNFCVLFCAHALWHLGKRTFFVVETVRSTLALRPFF